MFFDLHEALEAWKHKPTGRFPWGNSRVQTGLHEHGTKGQYQSMAWVPMLTT